MTWLGSIQSWLYSGAGAELKDLAAGVDALKLLAAMSFAAVFGSRPLRSPFERRRDSERSG